MKQFYLILLLCFSLPLSAASNSKGEWQSTTLSDATIKKVQTAKYQYMQCITKDVQNKSYVKMDTRAATDKVMKKCESLLAQVRVVFLTEKVPPEIADRYLKMSRTQTARNVHKQLMFADATRKMSQ